MTASALPPHVRRLAVVVVLGSIMSVLDTTIVNVALDTLGRDLHSSLDDVQWVATGYLLALAAVIPLTAWATRRLGARRLYVISLVLFTAGSALCGLAWSAGSLIAFRVLQGLGGGLIQPVGMSLLARASGPQNIGRVMSVIGVPIVLAPVFGPTIGGLMLDNFGWNWIFFVNVPVGIVAVIAALRMLPATQAEEAGPFDWTGFALLSTGLPAIVYGLAEIGTHGGVDHGSVLVPGLAGLVLVAGFVAHALRAERPLLDIRLFADRAFGAASLTTFMLGAAMFGGMLLLPLYFQQVRGEDVVATGLLLIPQGLGAAVGMNVSGRLSDRFGGGPVALGGILITSVMTLPFVLIGATTSYLLISVAMVFRGIGLGTSMMPAMTAAYAVLRPDQVNDATPQLNVLMRVGGSVGTAVLTVVLSQRLAGTTSAAGAADAFGGTFGWAMAATLVSALPAVLLVAVERRARRARALGAEVPDGVAVDARVATEAAAA